MAKDNFIIHLEYREQMNILTAEQKGMLLDALCDYAESGAEPSDLDSATQMLYVTMRQRMDRETDNYEKKVTRLKSNGAKGGRPKANSEADKKPNGFSENQMVSGENLKNQMVSRENLKNQISDVPVPVPVPVPDIKRESVREKRERFSPPTPGQVTEYAKQAGLIIDAEKFCDYYASKGWKVGPSSPMKDWKAAARNWARNDSKYSQPSQTARSGTRGNFCAYGHEQIDWNALGKMISNNGSG